jgi:hypothetical protein
MRECERDGCANPLFSRSEVWLNRSQTHDHKEVGPQIIKLLGRSKLECFIL